MPDWTVIICGISAFSLAPDSKVNARALAHALLTSIESRGSHASGFAYSTEEGKTGFYKEDRPGSQLVLGTLPRRANTVILHTRFATQGSPKDNRNNHPVISPDGQIALVHNGVISNDDRLRSRLGLTKAHGEVDSLVIPALLQESGPDGLGDLAGYAAIAWIDSNNPDMLEIARLKTSPVAYTWLFDGSFVMASTPELLRSALDSLTLGYGGVFEMSDQRQITVSGGFIWDHVKTQAMAYNHSAYTRFQGATSGRGPSVYTGAATPTTKVTTCPTVIKGTEDAAPEGSCEVDVDAYFADLEEWRRKRDEDDRAAVLSGDDDEFDEDTAYAGYGMTSDDERVAISAIEKYMTDPAYVLGEDVPQATAGYYAISHDDNVTNFPSLDDLEQYLRWLGRMTRTEFDLFQGLPREEHWANYLSDIGAMDEDGTFVSWVDDMADIDEHESPAVRHLDYIRAGVGHLLKLKGA